MRRQTTQLPFLLQAVPTASLVLPPFGTARRNWQLYKHTQISHGKEYLLLAGAYVLNVGENGVDGLALWALNVHEETVWSLYKSLEFIKVLFLCWVGVKKIDLHIVSNKVLVYLIIINKHNPSFIIRYTYFILQRN